MFTSLQPGRSRNRRLALVASLCVHLAVIGALHFRPEPVLLRSEGALKGFGGRGAATIVYLPGASVTVADKAQPRDEDQRSRTSFVPPTQKYQTPSAVQAASTSQELKPGMPGYILGSLAYGFADEHDVRIALPVEAPDPPIARSKLPDWIRGDVIVEVTIDEYGTVVSTRVLQTVGFGLDDIVVETLRHWHFVPARVDGVAVASRQDVHFHFPS